MDKQQTNDNKVRPTKKQLVLLKFIEDFIAEHGYSPSYREVMTGLDYTSVATVSLHINSLIARGHLIKRGRSARSLELVDPSDKKLATNQVQPGEEKWLVEKIEYHFAQAEDSPEILDEEISKLNTLLQVLKILDLDGAAHSFQERFSKLKKRNNNLG